jgi:hypothetical protein
LEDFSGCGGDGSRISAPGDGGRTEPFGGRNDDDGGDQLLLLLLLLLLPSCSNTSSFVATLLWMFSAGCEGSLLFRRRGE